MNNKKTNWLLLFLTVAFSLLIVFYKSAFIPKNLSFDEVEFAKLALSLQNKPYIPYSTLATGHSTLYFYILLASLKTFGITKFALRLPSAVFGISSIFVFYILMKRIFQDYKNKNINKYLPFLLSCLLVTSHWFLNFARFSFEATFLLFLELTAVYCFVIFVQSKCKNGRYLFLSGFFSGLAFLSYTPGRIFFLLILGFLFLHFIKSKLKNTSVTSLTAKQFLYFLIPFIITIAPLSLYLSSHVDTRIDQEFFLNNHEVTLPVKVAGLWQNISSTALMFNIKGDVNGRQNYPNKPALNPFLGILFIVGLIISIRYWREDNNKLFLGYFTLSLIPALMTYPWENPSMLRTYTALPAVIYFAGLALLFFDNLATKILKKQRVIILIGIYIIVISSSFYELRTYFKYQSTVFNQAFEIKLPLDKAIKVKN